MAIKESVSIDETIDLLNGLLKLDRSTISALVNFKVPCNKELANHPTVQVTDPMDGSEYRVGLLGIVNGLFGVFPDGWGAIVAVVDIKDHLILYFERVKKEDYIKPESRLTEKHDALKELVIELARCHVDNYIILSHKAQKLLFGHVLTVNENIDDAIKGLESIK